MSQKVIEVKRGEPVPEGAVYMTSMTALVMSTIDVWIDVFLVPQKEKEKK
jgi:hypothetical protein